jgi:HPt (histidine-containing phosphotransfer) domain-containing protein
MKNFLETDAVIFDYEGTLERLMNDCEFVKTVVDSFLDHFDEQFNSLNEAFSVGDAPLAKRHAHSMKGASINAGAMAICKLSGTIETLAENNRLAEIEPLITQLPGQLNLFKEAFEKALAVDC